MKPTMRDVAISANVSTATVSRVINNSPKVSKKARDAIQTAMDELNYEPYYRFAMKSMKVIGLLVPDINSMFYPIVLKGIEEELIKKQYNVFFCHTSGSIEEEKIKLDVLLNKNADGIILFGSRPKESKDTYIKNIGKKVPIVMINDSVLGSNIYSIMTDEVDGEYKAIDYLIKLGHKKIAFINGNLDYITYRDKLLGYKNALTDNGIDIRDDLIVDEVPYEIGGYNATEKLLALKDRPTAIAAISDQVAMGVYKAIYEEGFSIPKDFSVFGFGDVPVVHNLYPELTSVNQFPYRLGVIASKTILKVINKEKIEQKKIFLECQLSIRNSCIEI